jgi:hypothetical protein
VRHSAAARSDVALVAALAVIACLVCAALPAGLAIVRVPLALPLVLVLPGYASVTALFAPGALRGPERLVLSLALSIAAAILSGLIIDGVGLKLVAQPWVDVLGAFTLAACAVAIRRGHARELMFPSLQLHGQEALAITAAVVLLGAAAVVGFMPLAPPAKTDGTVGFGLLEAPHGPAVCVTVTNEQFHTAGYRVLVTAAGRPPATLTTARLAPGATWTHEVVVGAGRPVVRATLFRAGARAGSSPYRRTDITTWAPYLRARTC